MKLFFFAAQLALATAIAIGQYESLITIHYVHNVHYVRYKFFQHDFKANEKTISGGSGPGELNDDSVPGNVRGGFLLFVLSS